MTEADAASKRYLSDLCSRLNPFAEIFDGKPIAEITALALEFGHASADLVFQHYRQLVKPKQAERYRNIMPAVRSRGDRDQWSQN